MRTHWHRIDRRIEHWLYVFGHTTHPIALGLVFIWFGVLKLLGAQTATSIIATTIYFGDPKLMVPVLGAWEIAIGVCLVWRRLHRVALLLLAIRLPGTLLALILRADACFVEVPFVPTIAGQYIIKDLLLFTAAAVVGGYVTRPPHRLGTHATGRT
ncbi:MAG: hypothetical protein ACF8SC_03400 [Phycisphaerales bacterium JB037]